MLADLSDVTSGRRAASEIATLELPIAGLLNNAGIHSHRTAAGAQGWDATFATNHLGPFALTDALVPHLRDGANVVFVCSGVEDPGRRPAVVGGFRGGRYISAEASARGEWAPGGSALAGGDAYATSKRCNLAPVFALARETPRLRFNAVEPGFNPGTDLRREANVPVRLLLRYVASPFAPLIKYWSTPKHAGRVVATILTDGSDRTGIYYDDNGRPMLGSRLVRDPGFQDRVVGETRALLETVPTPPKRTAPPGVTAGRIGFGR